LCFCPGLALDQYSSTYVYPSHVTGITRMYHNVPAIFLYLTLLLQFLLSFYLDFPDISCAILFSYSVLFDLDTPFLAMICLNRGIESGLKVFISSEEIWALYRMF
jgi:hypothetical protein